MSKRRQFRNNSNPIISQYNLLAQSNRSRRWSKNTKIIDRIPLSRSLYTADVTRSKNPQEKLDLTQYKRDKITSKNYSSFRGIFNQNDTSQVPFMSTLREWEFKSCEHNDNDNENGNTQEFKNGGSTMFQLFKASLKTTANMKLSKCIRDIHADPFRLSRSYYRWHNKSGQGVKNSTEFQCTLRAYRNCQNEEFKQDSFNNTIRPIKYIDVEPKDYQTEDLVCERQKKIFRLRQAGRVKGIQKQRGKTTKI